MNVISVPEHLWHRATTAFAWAGLSAEPVETSPDQTPRYILRGVGAPAPVDDAALSEREMQVLRGMSEGKTNSEIAEDLYLSPLTIKSHAQRIYRELGVHDRAQAVHVGWQIGLLGGVS